MYKIYIVEDDSTILSIIVERLTRWGLECLPAGDFGNITAEFAQFRPHLVLMDINLPRYDGFYWCNQLRSTSKVPILFISSRTDDSDKIRAMAGGGDDYLEKPFSMDVLTAKVQAILRRTYDYTDSEFTTLGYGNLLLDIERMSASCGEKSVLLTHNECTILGCLMRAGGKVVSRARIIKALWEDESFVDDNTLTVNITRLRQKLAQIIPDEIITTVKGQGYMLL